MTMYNEDGLLHTTGPFLLFIDVLEINMKNRAVLVPVPIRLLRKLHWESYEGNKMRHTETTRKSRDADPNYNNLPYPDPI